MQVIISGPTACGKTSMSLRLASDLSGEIINADSVQIYQGLDIGSAKPTIEERSHVPHHLFDIMSPERLFSAGDYVRAVAPLLDDLTRRQRLPLFVGGTSLYLSALLSGLSDLPKANDELRSELEQKESAELFTLLRNVDPETAERLHQNDRLRVIRALEVFRITGEKMSVHHRESSRGIAGNALVVVLVPDRQKLYQRINLRSQLMVQNGILDETSRVLESFGKQSPCLKSLGYAQCLAYLEGDIESLEELTESIAQQTRKFAKRQMTFWRQEPLKRGWQIHPRESEAGVLKGNEPSPHMQSQSTAGMRVLEYCYDELRDKVSGWLQEGSDAEVSPKVIYVSSESL